jgi:RNA polymerase sigma-70 factor, ECF subfamily
MADDADLARRAAAGEQSAAGEIYDRYAPLVRAIALDATGSLAEANDLVQEVFLRALSRLGQLRRPELLCGWLVGIARREGIEYRRQSARRRRRFTPLNSEPAQADEAPLDDATEPVRQAVSELPERERIAVHIHYLCGEPAEAARQSLGLSASGFYKLLERARGRLRAQLVKFEGRP